MCDVSLNVSVNLLLQYRRIALCGELCLNLLLVEVAFAALVHAGLLNVAGLNVTLREALFDLGGACLISDACSCLISV